MSAGRPSRAAIGPPPAHRLVVALVALGLMAAACDGDDPPDGSPVSDVTERATTTLASSTTEATGTTAPTTDVPVPTPAPNGSTDVDRPPVPDGSGGEATGPLSSADVDVETDEGTVQIGDAEIPASAAGFPVPEGLDIEFASDIGTDAGFSGSTEVERDAMADFYRLALPEAGFEIVEEQRIGRDPDAPTVYIFVIRSADQQGDVAVTTGPGGLTNVHVLISDR